MAAEQSETVAEVLGDFADRRQGGQRIKLGYGAIQVTGAVLLGFVPLLGCIALVGGPLLAPYVLGAAVSLFVVFMIAAFVFAALRPASALLGGADYTVWHRQEIAAGLRSQAAISNGPTMANPALSQQGANDAPNT